MLPSVANYWKFDGDFQDSITLLYLVPNNNTLVSFVSDRNRLSNSAIYLDSGYLQAPADIYFTNTNTFTILFWIIVWSKSSTSYDTFIFDFGTATRDTDDVYIAIDGSLPDIQPYIRIEGNGRYTYQYFTYNDLPVKSLSIGTWYQLCATNDGNLLSTYINGNFMGKQALQNTIQSVTRTNSFFGSSTSRLPAPANFFLDDVIFMTKALTSTEIANFFTLTSSLTPSLSLPFMLPSFSNYWKFDGGFQDSITLSNLVPNKGSLVSFVSNRNCLNNSAIYLNSGYLQAPADIYFTNNFTILLWLNVLSKTSTSYDTFIIDFGTATADADDIVIAIDSGLPGIQPYIRTNGNGIYTFQYFAFYNLPVTHLSIGTWYQLAATCNANLTTYVNGNYANSYSLNNPIRNVTRTNSFFGSSTSRSPAPANFLLDDVIFMTKALTITQVASFYENSF